MDPSYSILPDNENLLGEPEVPTPTSSPTTSSTSSTSSNNDKVGKEDKKDNKHRNMVISVSVLIPLFGIACIVAAVIIFRKKRSTLQDRSAYRAHGIDMDTIPTLPYDNRQ